MPWRKPGQLHFCVSSSTCPAMDWKVNASDLFSFCLMHSSWDHIAQMVGNHVQWCLVSTRPLSGHFWRTWLAFRPPRKSAGGGGCFSCILLYIYLNSSILYCAYGSRNKRALAVVFRLFRLSNNYEPWITHDLSADSEDLPRTSWTPASSLKVSRAPSCSC